MQRFIPDGRYLSSLVVAVSATLAACGGGSTETSTTTSSASQSASGSADDAPVQDAAVGDLSGAKDILVPGTDADSPVTVAMVTTNTAADASASDLVQSANAAPLAAISPSPSTVTARSGVGLNLSAMSYYASEVATFDVMKRGSAWLTQCSGTLGCSNFAPGVGSWDTKEENALDLDANGYPRTLPAATDTAVKYRKVTTMLSANGTLPGGRYTIVYDGAGTLAYGGSVTKQAALSKAGRDIVDLATGATTSMFLTIAATTPGNYIRNIRVYLPGGACASNLQVYAADANACGGSKGAFVPFESFPKTSVWSPQFLADVKGFRTLRFMDWGATNVNMLESWGQRPLMSDRTWASTKGVPVEAMLDLGNTVAADPWMNLPAHVNDDYIIQFGRLAIQKLSPALKVNIEYANEPWNYAFPVAKWMLAQAQAAWPDEVAKGTSIYTLQNNWYARRLVQACGLVKNASVGASSRFRCVSNTQAAQPAMTEQVLACAVAAKSLGQACGKSIDVVSIAPYFGYYLGSTTVRSMVTSWLSAPDGGLDKVFQELTGHDAAGQSITVPLATTASQAPAGAIAQATSWMVGTKAVAAKYGLPMWAYEGGQHLVPSPGDTDATLSNLMIAANRDPRMQGAYEQMMANWQSSGGQVFAYFNHAAVPSKSGSWGLKESMADNGNAKWKAALEKRDSACWWSGC